MCDYSLHHVKSRPAKVGDQLTTRDFNLGTRGFAASEDRNVAVCVLPGTELSFANAVTCIPRWPFPNNVHFAEPRCRCGNITAISWAAEFPERILGR